MEKDTLKNIDKERKELTKKIRVVSKDLGVQTKLFKKAKSLTEKETIKSEIQRLSALGTRLTEELVNLWSRLDELPKQ